MSDEGMIPDAYYAQILDRYMKRGTKVYSNNQLIVGMEA
jgi:hypothetical protein